MSNCNSEGGFVEAVRTLLGQWSDIVFKSELTGALAEKENAMTALELKAKYEGNANTNAYTDVDKGKVLNVPANTTQELADIMALLSSDDTSLDELQELVNFIKTNKNNLDTLVLDNIAETVTNKHFTALEKTKLQNVTLTSSIGPLHSDGTALDLNPIFDTLGANTVMFFDTYVNELPIYAYEPSLLIYIYSEDGTETIISSAPNISSAYVIPKGKQGYMWRDENVRTTYYVVINNKEENKPIVIQENYGVLSDLNTLNLQSEYDKVGTVAVDYVPYSIKELVSKNPAANGKHLYMGDTKWYILSIPTLYTGAHTDINNQAWTEISKGNAIDILTFPYSLYTSMPNDMLLNRSQLKEKGFNTISGIGIGSSVGINFLDQFVYIDGIDRNIVIGVDNKYKDYNTSATSTIVSIKQDATGGRTTTWGSQFSVMPHTPDLSPNKKNIYSVLRDSPHSLVVVYVGSV